MPYFIFPSLNLALQACGMGSVVRCSSWYGRGCAAPGQVGSSSWCLSATPQCTHRCVHADLPGWGCVGTRSFPWEWMTEQGNEKVDVGVVAPCQLPLRMEPNTSASWREGFASGSMWEAQTQNLSVWSLSLLGDALGPPWRIPFSHSVSSRSPKPTFSVQAVHSFFSYLFLSLSISFPTPRGKGKNQWSPNKY